MTQTPVRGSKPSHRSSLSPLKESQKNMERLRRRRLFLGSVSSLSFEEEENDFYHCEAEERPISPISRCMGSSGSELSQRSGSTDSVSNSVATRSSPSNQSLEVFVRSPVAHLRHFELHEFLTDRLEEQVAYLIRVSHQDRGDLAFVGLHTTLTEAVHDILHMSEDEPYGVRGATVILKMREQANGRESERSLGVIAVDNNMVSTFRLTLILKEEKRLGVAFKNWLVEQFTGGKKELVISGQYEVRKEQLYRSSSGSRLAQFHL